MPKKILLIENDAAFAGELTRALEASGFEPRVSTDGKDAIDLARELAPDAIVLCVELPGMSGYLVCQKLKKDEALKAVPLVLTSAEATEETFEKHRTLKARADEYMLKPYEPSVLVEKLGALVGLPEGAAGADHGEEEVVSLEEETGLEATAEGEPGQEIPGLDLQSLPDEPAAAGGGIEPDELKLLDEAFDGLAAPPAPDDAAAALDLELAGEKPVRLDDVDAAAASLPDEDEGAARADLGALDDEAERALGALGGADESLSLPDEPKPSPTPVRGASADLLRAAGIKVLDGDAPRHAEAPAPPGAASDEAVRRLEREVEELRRSTGELARRAEDAEAQARRAQDETDAAREEARRAEEEARAVDAELADLRTKLAEAERRAAQAEEEARRRGEEAEAAVEAIAKADALEREADELRTELLVARGEAEGARGEVEKRTVELRRRVGELEAASAKNEERVVKAYQKIKADEKVREKVRKALAIATQLLEDGLSAEPSADKDRRPAAASRE